MIKEKERIFELITKQLSSVTDTAGRIVRLLKTVDDAEECSFTAEFIINDDGLKRNRTLRFYRFEEGEETFCMCCENTDQHITMDTKLGAPDLSSTDEELKKFILGFLTTWSWGIPKD